MAFTEETAYPALGALIAVLVYFFFFYEKKKSKKEQDQLDKELLDAAQAGDISACKEKVEEGARLRQGTENITKRGKKHAIHAAAQYGHIELMEWLVLEEEVPVELPDFADMRPLHYAAMKGRTKMCKLLLRMKASPQATDTADYSCVHFAASGGYEETLCHLIKAGGDVNGRDKGGHTPLMLAAVKGQSAAVKWLLENGADRYLKQKDGVTAHKFALRRQHKKVISLLEGEPVKVVPQTKRDEAVKMLQEETSKSVASTTAEGDDDRTVPKKGRKEQVKPSAAKLLQAHGKQQSKKLASSLTKAGIGQFQPAFDAHEIKEKYPEAWERAVAEMGEDVLNSLLEKD